MPTGCFSPYSKCYFCGLHYILKKYKYALNMLCFQALVVKDQYQSASQELGFI